ncbi:MAG: pyruvate formate lyase-activating protein [Bacteroidales bacterium]|nr:pyruvate formate lyase-activating protein [Bacteroidales bacterium]
MIGKIHSIETFGTVDGPGIRFVVFLQGCPLRCLFCHNPDTWNVNAPVKYEMSEDELFKEMKRYKSFIKSGGVTFSGGEPLMQADFVENFFRICKENSFHTTLDTSGYIFSEKVVNVLNYTDLVLLDIKTLDANLHEKYTSKPLDNTLKFLDYLEKISKPVWIRHVVVPTYTDDDEKLSLLANFLKKYSVVQKVELLPFHTLGFFKYENLGITNPLKHLEDLSDDRIKNARNIFKTILEKVEVC